MALLFFNWLFWIIIYNPYRKQISNQNFVIMQFDTNRNYGKEPGLLQQNFVDLVNDLIEMKHPGAEPLIYVMYDYVDKNHFRDVHDYEDGRTPDTPEIRNLIQNGKLALHYLMNLTTNYGVELKPMEPPYHGVAPTNSFKKWHQFWNTHYESLSDTQKSGLMDAIIQKRDASRFLPVKSWND